MFVYYLCKFKKALEEMHHSLKDMATFNSAIILVNIIFKVILLETMCFKQIVEHFKFFKIKVLIC